MKFNKRFLKISKEAELRISRSSLFHSLITDGKKEFLKKLCLTLKGVMLSEFFNLNPPDISPFKASNWNKM